MHIAYRKEAGASTYFFFYRLTDTKVYGVVAIYAHELTFSGIVAVNFIEVCTAGA